MKYLVLAIRKDDDYGASTHPILEDAQKAYAAAKENKANSGVYLCAILKEIDL